MDPQPIVPPNELPTTTPISQHTSYRATIISTVIFTLVCVLIGYVVYQEFRIRTQPNGCTKEAKICPDGTSVGRTGPKCEFTPCPAVSPSPSNETSGKQKTFYGKGYKFTYPNNYMIEINENEEPTVYIQTVNPYECTGGGCFQGYRPLSISLVSEASTRSLSDIVAESVNTLQSIAGKDTKILTRKSQFGTYPSTIIESECMGYCRTTLFKKTDSMLYTITELYGNKTEMDEYSRVANQILSTFTFIK